MAAFVEVAHRECWSRIRGSEIIIRRAWLGTGIGEPGAAVSVPLLFPRYIETLPIPATARSALPSSLKSLVTRPAGDGICSGELEAFTKLTVAGRAPTWK